ncbi:MAG: ribosomal protein S18-alanine N-acetyltransferase [Gemmatimonadetes bacterium]|nr:ribosomal protein S18-alanine N-acetyltransferase [Gemmatimonadota bacterium]
MTEAHPFVIGKMDRSHIPRVLEIERACYPAPWSESAFHHEITSGASVALVAMDAESVAGFLVGWIAADQVHVANIAVAAGYRQRGVGTGMMLRLLEEAVRRGCTSSSLEVRESNLAGRSMYSRLGYHAVALRKSYYSNPAEDAVVMVKDLEA